MTDLKIISRREAAKNSLLKYYTGKACLRGHIAERYVKSATCTECNKQNCKKYYEQYFKEIK